MNRVEISKKLLILSFSAFISSIEAKGSLASQEGDQLILETVQRSGISFILSRVSKIKKLKSVYYETIYRGDIMTLRIPDDKPVYVIITLGVHENQTPSDSPEVVRVNLEEWGVDGAFVVYNRGFSGAYGFWKLKDGSPGYFMEIKDSNLLEHGIVFNAFGNEFYGEKSPVCIPRENYPTPEYLDGWIDPYKIKTQGIDFNPSYRAIVDKLVDYVDSNTLVLFDLIRYPNRPSGEKEDNYTAFCPNCYYQTWANHITNVTEATGVLKAYMTNNLPLYSGSFLGVLHTPRDHVDYSCMKAWNLGQAYDDNKGLTRYLDAGVAMLMYYAPNEMYVKWMRDLAKNGDSASGYSTSGTSKRLYFLMTVEEPHYWTSDLQEVIDEALQWFDGIILYNYRSLAMRGGIERI